MSSLTQDIVHFISQFDQYKVDPAAYRLAKMGIMDSMACMFAGSEEPVVQILARHFGQQAGNGQADVAVPFLGQKKLPLEQAACLWATAAHALDYDDVAMSAHPSTVLMPVVMTGAFKMSASGQEVLNAYVVGYEVWAELFTREKDPYHIKGWHPTAVFGIIAGAAAYAYLNRLPQEQLLNALGIAASMASGLVANFGTMTKPFHAGRAASMAIEAVELARAGMTACPDVFEHKAGFLKAISPAGNVDTDKPAELGKTWRLAQQGLNIKQYPVCYSGHRVIDGALDIINKENFDLEEIATIVATIGQPQASMLRNPCPETGLEAKFSLEFDIACALLLRKVGLAELSDDFVKRADLRAIYPKISIAITDALDPADAAFALHDRIVISLKNGQVFDSGDIRYPVGHANLPLDAETLKAKFMDCLQIWHNHTGIADKAQPLFKALSGLEQQDNIRVTLDGIFA
ncbi:MmgE/PrpD family protein [Advenella sp. WQ 585]|uniref:MmgE/PrpD family protein n=1 Tax=Advenella mandrilli TaxID=2800330 RepID=A0ABS1E9D5_9BURK|nr:MmgE/PrpD family protein [Advenella mandrilli]MBK1780054.1 MmgE/PrpD family protein [Advenella mandrilli]